MHDQPPFTSLAALSHEFGKNLSDIQGDGEHLSVWHGINNLEAMGIANER
jgi:hypothetical protein